MVANLIKTLKNEALEQITADSKILTYQTKIVIADAGNARRNKCTD